MLELWFVCAIGFLSLLSTIISSKGSLFDSRFKWYKRLTKRGKLVSLIGLVIVILSIWQYVTIKRKEDKKEILQLEQRKTSDSIISSEIKKGVESNRRQLFNDLSETLAKQNLKIDTVTKTVEKLRDSAKTIILNTPKESPIIIVRDGGITHIKKKDTLELTISLVSTQASAKLISLDYLCEVNYPSGSKANTMKVRLLSQILMPKDQLLSKSFNIYTDNQIDFVNIVLLGKFTSTENNKEILLKDVYQYSLLTKKVGFLQGDEKEIFFEKYSIK